MEVFSEVNANIEKVFLKYLFVSWISGITLIVEMHYE